MTDTQNSRCAQTQADPQTVGGLRPAVRSMRVGPRKPSSALLRSSKVVRCIALTRFDRADDNTPWPKQSRPHHHRPRHRAPFGRAGRSAHHGRSRRHPARPGRQPALLAPSRHRSAMLPHPPCPPCATGTRRHHLGATAKLHRRPAPTQDQEVKPPAGGGGSRVRQRLERHLRRVWSPENPPNGP